MASQGEITERKRELVARLDRLRDGLGPDRAALVRTFNPLGRIGPALGRHPLRTFGFTCLGTALFTLLWRRRPRSRKAHRATLRGTLFAALLGALQPALRHWVAYMVKQRLSATTKVQSPDSLLGP
jgi:hypothetical protein